MFPVFRAGVHKDAPKDLVIITSSLDAPQEITDKCTELASKKNSTGPTINLRLMLAPNEIFLHLMYSGLCQHVISDHNKFYYTPM